MEAHQQYKNKYLADSGRMAELADALGSGPSVRKDMGVQVPLRPPVNLLSMVKTVKLVDENMPEMHISGLEGTD